MAGFSVETIDLSMRPGGVSGHPELATQANVYTLPGVEEADGTLRKFSIGQLVLAICLTRAADLERVIVEKMEAMSQNTADLEELTKLDQNLAEWCGNASNKNARWNPSADLQAAFQALGEPFYSAACSYDEAVELMSRVESKMDSLNSVSQTTLIDIQSLTSKRDDAYNLATNFLKTVGNIIMANVNNF